MHDRRDGVEEGERAFAGQLAERLRQGRGRERAGGDDHTVPLRGRQAGDLAALEADQRMGENRRLDRLGEAVAIDGKGAAGRHLMRVGAAHDRCEPSARISRCSTPTALARSIVGAERIRADELGETPGTVRVRRCDRPHLVQHDRRAGLRRLPRGFRARQSPADDVNGTHGTTCHKACTKRQPVVVKTKRRTHRAAFCAAPA